MKMENADLHGQNIELEKQLQFFKEEAQLLQDSLKDSEEKRAELKRTADGVEDPQDMHARRME